jgi:hypothetical protein
VTSAHRTWLVAAVAFLTLSAGCGNEPGAATSSSEPAGERGRNDAADARFDCPLTAEQVSAILGTPVEKDETTCTYGPSSGGLPVAGFLAQLPELCASGFPEQAGYTEPVDSLGVDAFLKVAGEATAEIWVCSPAAFTVYVDTGDAEPAAGIADAEELAKAALAAG